ncbi:uncharacterized protein ColSpa_04192 [Colletotrichum spaethianum]|uniref:Uncharacterized protein n=1 Tax=Colletotrichum spaethianum TaxID=700344 RepID=A0AA37L8X7_9PEZI|nr:uncharacterized protein ColSpa_04192 [Colletotrichum spaethianum]GKT44011.1 hypothetical protein ColSpa_04192 [Colletotrichum spaethianum]
MRVSIPTILTGLFMAKPILASISSPLYLPFELEKRDCGFSYCDCQRVQCQLDFCFDDHVDPWVLVDSALNRYYGVDCGQWDSWQRNDPAQWCNNGLRQGNGIFYINRKFGSLGKAFSVSYKNENVTDPNRGSVSGTCRPVQNVQCKCHSVYNATAHDCSVPCKD